MVLVDSNILLDIWDDDPIWAPWSKKQMLYLSRMDEIAINPVIYAEISVRFPSRSQADAAVENLGLILLDISCEAAFLAGLAFLKYRRQGGARTGVLPDFFIGAQALAGNLTLLTREARRYATYFPNVRLITPPARP